MISRYRKKAHTLVEVMVVLVIIISVGGVALSLYRRNVEYSKARMVIAKMRELAAAMDRYSKLNYDGDEGAGGRVQMTHYIIPITPNGDWSAIGMQNPNVINSSLGYQFESAILGGGSTGSFTNFEGRATRQSDSLQYRINYRGEISADSGLPDVD